MHACQEKSGKIRKTQEKFEKNSFEGVCLTGAVGINIV